MGQWITPQRDGAPMRAYLATPRDHSSATPSVVIAMHVWGVDAQTRGAADRFAEAGFMAIAPDLFARFDAPSGDGATDHEPFVAFAKQLTPEMLDADFGAAVDDLRKRAPQGKIAIAGFCMGGVMALKRTGAGTPFSAAAVWYGSVERANPPEESTIPIVASYGADDHGIPVAGVEAFREQLSVPNDFKIYPVAAHGFTDSKRKAYDADATDDSYRRTIDFLRRYLA